MPGRPKDKLKYLNGLNEKDFPFLIADILNLHYNHSNIKIMDGTGDGKRDIFSIDQKGNRVITQCKFHYDFSKTSGSSETDEIVIALNKFGYNHGFFCTSGKLSPQSKREYSDNYINFSLNWIEGHEMVDIVLENPTLRRIWFENEKIHLIDNRISIPFILRKLPEGILFEYNFPDSLALQNEIHLKIKQREFINPRQLHPLNHLDIRKSKNAFGREIGYCATIEKNVNFNSINDAKEEILNILLNDTNFQFEDSYVSIRFGIPYFPEQEESYRNFKAEKFNLPINSETYVVYKDAFIDEYDFLIDVTDDWKLPDRIHMSQLDNFCYYNQEQDFVFYLEYTCEVSKDLHPHIVRQIEIEKVIWSKSLFIIVDNNSDELFADYPPDELYIYTNIHKLFCWIHPTPMIHPADVIEFENSLKNDEFELLKTTIINVAHQNNLEIIDWQKASKIIAINNDDPFPSNPKTTYRLVDIFEEFDTIPSPINPESRLFIFECVFFLSEHNDLLLKERINSLEELFDGIGNANHYNFTIDDQTTNSIFLRAVYNPAYKLHLSTLENLKILNKDAQQSFENIEKKVKKIFPKANRYTNDYWFEELGVFLKRD